MLRSDYVMRNIQHGVRHNSGQLEVSERYSARGLAWNPSCQHSTVASPEMRTTYCYENM